MIGTLILAGLCLLGIFLRTVSPAINTGYGNLIADIGVLVAFYYGATGIACAWAYRKVMLTNTRFFFTGVLLPFLSGIFCFWVGYEVIKQSGAAASASVLVTMALGVPLIFIARYATHSDFFHCPAIAYDSIEPSPGSTTAGLWAIASRGGKACQGLLDAGGLASLALAHQAIDEAPGGCSSGTGDVCGGAPDRASEHPGERTVRLLAA